MLLNAELKNNLEGVKRLAILGIGSALRGDDSAGLAVIEDLAGLEARSNLPVELFRCGDAPENYTGAIKKFAPTHIIIVDAAEMGKEPGTAAIIDPAKDSSCVSCSTHGLPLTVFIDYLYRSLSCCVICVGIQPAALELGKTLSPQALVGVKEVSKTIKEALEKT